MTLFSEATRVYVVLGATDMRKSFDTLAGLVKDVIREDPLTGHVFVFSNRHRNRIKLLWWDGTGLCVLAKRLERGRFPWPRRDDESLEMTRDGQERSRILVLSRAGSTDGYNVAVGVDELQGRVADHESRIDVLTSALEAERREKRDLQHYIDYLRRMRHGPKGEKLDPAQLRIPFEDLVEIIEEERPRAPLQEALEAPDAESPEDRIPKRYRKRGAHGRKPLPADLPRQRVEHDLDADDRCCPTCAGEMTRIGETVTEELDYVPASLIVREHVRPKYACKPCQGSP